MDAPGPLARYVVIGAGAVGGAVAGELARVGCDVVVVARGAHLDAIAARGLEIVTPSGTRVERLRAAASAGEIAPGPRDVVIVATKSDDTRAALAPLHGRDVPIVCAQNGVGNERVAREISSRVYGALVFAPLSHLEPGRVCIHAAPRHGAIDVGCDPRGVDGLVHGLVADLARAGWDARAEPEIRAWKHGKLLSNLGNVLEAIGGRAALVPAWLAALEAEAEACFRAAGIAYVPASEVRARYAGVRVALPRAGGSTWQSLARGRRLEADALHGEIVRLGAEHGVPTPWNARLRELARRAERERWAPGSRSVAEIAEWVGA